MCKFVFSLKMSPSFACILGKIPLQTWCQIVEKVTELNVPWRVLAGRLVTLCDDGKNVLYRHQVKFQVGQNESSFVNLTGQVRYNVE